ncbi:hypothetical protein MS3_00000111 [Schistosoma haematobium]|uniref:Uncharacterized protein n=1 Tax=Schistosoma haematobium TaxID=6185 RepID=A0A922LKN4_SCHHA|nr:hypothetical protein MS3_00000111 [Schistosoma haematobium]KAH9588050.1 hypothetical protein MS3_00000111 [Schistosoma haematobium]
MPNSLPSSGLATGSKPEKAKREDPTASNILKYFASVDSNLLRKLTHNLYKSSTTPHLFVVVIRNLKYENYKETWVMISFTLGLVFHFVSLCSTINVHYCVLVYVRLSVCT